MSLPVLAPLVLLGCCYGAQQGLAVGFVTLQSWYKSGQDHVSIVNPIVHPSLCVCVCFARKIVYHVPTWHLTQ